MHACLGDCVVWKMEDNDSPLLPRASDDPPLLADTPAPARPQICTEENEVLYHWQPVCSVKVQQRT